MTSISLEKYVDHLPFSDRLMRGKDLARQAFRTLIEHPDTPETASKTPSARPDFTTLDELRLAYVRSEEAAFRDRMSDSAEHLLDQQKLYEQTTRRHDAVGLTAVWSAIRAWEVTRNEPTEALAAHLLDEFPGAGQYSLTLAFERAKRSGVTFDEALDDVNEKHRQMAA